MELRQLRVLAIGAHPDDCEYYFGGTAAKYRALGHAVKFVSMTNGNAGHQTLGRLELAARRAGEAAKVNGLTGIEYEILANDDAALTTSLTVRAQVISVIRSFRPDLVFTHRPFDYHADHRATGLLVQDASFLLGVPAVCPQVPCLRHTPVILSFHDSFTRPVEFRADVVVDIDGTLEDKVRMLDCHKSQFYEWLPWVDREEDQVPETVEDRLHWLEQKIKCKDAEVVRRCRDLLLERYGAQRGRAVRHAEAFEVSEYGAQMTEEMEKELFPF
jgi:N-acetylglucosamine malate deacetylase 1